MPLDEPPGAVLHGWNDHLMPERVAWWREQVAEFGSPLFGLAGPLAQAGMIGGTLGGVPNRGVVVRYQSGRNQIEVTTARHGLGGTQFLLRRALEMSATTDACLPFSVTVTERLLMLAVSEGRSQFRVVETTSGHWIAVGGWKKRHLRVEGSPGTSPDEVALVEVVLP